MRKTLMIIESNKRQANAFVRLLKEYDYSVELAKSYDEAFSKIKIKRAYYHLCILDADFPGGFTEGLDACQRLKQDETTKKVPILLITCRSRLDDVMSALDAKADMFLLKPFDKDCFLERIKLIINDFESKKYMRRVIDFSLIEYLLFLKEDMDTETYLLSLLKAFNFTIWNKINTVMDFMQLRVTFESAKEELKSKYRFIDNISVSENGIKFVDLPFDINEISKDKRDSIIDDFMYFIYHFLNIVTVLSGKIVADMDVLKVYDKKS